MKELSVLLIICSALLVSAYPQIPEKYWGYAMLNGELAPAGTNITVEVTNTSEIVGSVLIEENGLYELDVTFDDLNTTEDGGAEENDSLTWYIAGTECTTPAPGIDKANSGKINGNFTIEAECKCEGDSDCDGTVTDFELLQYVSRWAQGTIEDFELLDAIDYWSGLLECPP